MNHFAGTLVAAMALLFSTVSAASIIQTGHVNTIDQLDWLDLSVTDGMSYSDALGANPGYRIATKAEFQSMFSLFEISGDGLFVDRSVNGSIREYDAYGYSRYYGKGDNDWLTNAFSEVFGSTHASSSSHSDIVASYGWYAEGHVQRKGGVYIKDLKNESYNDIAYAFSGYTHKYSDNGNYDHNFHAVGWFLVRDAIAVPEPSIIALFAAGFAGLGFSYRRRLRQ